MGLTAIAAVALSLDESLKHAFRGFMGFSQVLHLFSQFGNVLFCPPLRFCQPFNGRLISHQYSRTLLKELRNSRQTSLCLGLALQNELDSALCIHAAILPAMGYIRKSRIGPP